MDTDRPDHDKEDGRRLHLSLHETSQDESEETALTPKKVAARIDENLIKFEKQLSRLSTVLEHHSDEIEAGRFEGQDIMTVIKKIDPVMSQTIQQETRINEKLAERAGKAGQFAIDTGAARSEIWRRLTRLRSAGGD